ncbi:hypothetical protein QH494_18900, partial [Sphingomonas sp. AR_OL41]|nr:hypothetical protein [Sphingomonas sp. AR_OL41]
MNAPLVADSLTVAAPLRRRFAVPRNALVMGALAVAIAVAGLLWLTAPRSSETTDNAYIHADSSAVAPRVGGLV